MKKLARHHAPGLLGLGLALCALSGCSNRSELDILPAEARARAALEKALTAWKNGQKAGKIDDGSPKIEVVDWVWQGGDKLAAFEIVQAEDKPGPRWFSVKLTLQDSPGPQQVRYAVLGLDPLWVYREEDYKKACGMGD